MVFASGRKTLSAVRLWKWPQNLVLQTNCTASLLDFQIFPLDHRGGGGFRTPAGEHFRLGSIVSPGTEYVCIKPGNIMVLREDKTHSHDLENVVSG